MNARPSNRIFPAKLLLFGEYTVLSGSRALAIPIHVWNGSFVESGSIDGRLTDLIDYLDEKSSFNPGSVREFRNAVKQGLSFESDIPQGYGVGSSGALCAAIFNQFFDGERKKDIRQVREDLALIENFFHGQSSGLDPLVSLMQSPILRESGNYHVLREKIMPDDLIIFLLDSGTGRSTGKLVEGYLNKCQDPVFATGCVVPLTQSVDHVISFIMDSHVQLLWEHLQLISQIQFQYLQEMIYPSVSGYWLESLDRSDVVIKLCGAGGGGFYLGFARNKDAYKRFAENCKLTSIKVVQ